MNKMINICVAIAISTFLATNFYLLFSDKSIITKSVYVNEYELVTTGYYNEKFAKEAFVAPLETYTVYVGSDDAIEAWTVTEGDAVSVGEELAVLNTERAEGQRSTWETEKKALLQQETEMNRMIRELSSERSQANTGNTSNVDRQKTDVKDVDGKTKIELGLNVDFTVDVTQEGSYAQALSGAEQQLTEIERQLVVVEAQLAQNPARPALVSPIEGIVSDVKRHGSTLAVEIFSSQKVIMTYVKDDEWLKIEEGNRVLLNGVEIEIGQEDESSVLSVSKLPAKDDASLKAYKALDSTEAKNPLAYYEARIMTDAVLDAVPFGNHVNALVITNEEHDAIAVKKEWLRGLDDEVEVVILDYVGRAIKAPVTTSFGWKDRTIVTDGIELGDVAINESLIQGYDYAPETFLPMPSYMPKKAEWRAHGWRNYLNHIIIR